MKVDLYAEMTLDLLMHFRGKPEIVSLVPMESDMGVPLPIVVEEKIYWQIPFFISKEGKRVWLGIAVMDGSSGELSSYWRIGEDMYADNPCKHCDYLQGNLKMHIRTILQEKDTFQHGNILRAYLEKISEENQCYASIMPLCLKIQKLYVEEIS